MSEMEVVVRMLANDHGETHRVVKITPAPSQEAPDEEVLELVFRNGQNDFQPVAATCSVSVGDVIEYGGFHVVQPMGFAEISLEDLEEYTALPIEERVWSKFVR